MLPKESRMNSFVALVALTFRRHWRVRSLGWVTFGLVLLMSVAIAVFTHGPVGWRLENRPVMVADTMTEGAIRMTYSEYAQDRLAYYQMIPGPYSDFGIKTAVFAALRGPLADKPTMDDFAFLSFSRWVVFGMYLGFVMPLFTLAYASGAIGAEREGRTLIWLSTRPMPREAIYLAKFLGVLPWCVLVTALGFVVLCMAGGEIGRRAMFAYWPSVIGGSIGFAALFHLIGAIFRRPAVVGLVYVFFFETLVANLPGSLKRLSLNYYVRSLMYNEAASAGAATPASLDVYDPVGTNTAWIVLIAAAFALTIIGAFLFARQETQDDA